jgi:DNA helicase-2/ATP-dependent DNA helicase PcrA
MEEDLFPSVSMSTRSELEEERRLFYVALTRAESGLFNLCAIALSLGKLTDSEPSRLLKK